MNLNFNDIDPLSNKIIDNGRFKIVNSTVFDYSWDILDLKDNNKK